MKTVHVLYFAALREQRGADRETVETDAGTPQELYGRLRAERGLKLPWESLGVAVNGELSGGDCNLANGDTVAFLPPVAGG